MIDMVFWSEDGDDWHEVRPLRLVVTLSIAWTIEYISVFLVICNSFPDWKFPPKHCVLLLVANQRYRFV